jgi:LSD1 subclass zinc finger protein
MSDLLAGPMSTPCPSCGCSTPDGTLCSEDTAALAAMLAAVPQLLEQLDVAICRQAKTTSGGKAGKGTAHLKSPVNWGVAAVRDALLFELALWGTDVLAIRKRPDAGRAVSGIGRAIKDSFRAIDRAQDRQYLGTCFAEEDQAVCHAELWAKPGAHQVKCSQCETTHDVGERRQWLLDQAADMLCTAREASRYLGVFGGVSITEARIRGYIHRGRVIYHAGTRFRLGDLLAVVIDEGERKSA